MHRLFRLRPGISGIAAVLMLLAGEGLHAQSADEGPDTSRQTFDAEVCTVDELTQAQCQCAWEFLQKKMSARDLRIAMLLVASNSQDQAVGQKAYTALERAKVSDRKRDELSAEIAGLIVEAEDACMASP
jgi:hypothetical protein